MDHINIYRITDTHLDNSLGNWRSLVLWHSPAPLFAANMPFYGHAVKRALRQGTNTVVHHGVEHALMIGARYEARIGVRADARRLLLIHDNVWKRIERPLFQNGNGPPLGRVHLTRSPSASL